MGNAKPASHGWFATVLAPDGAVDVFKNPSRHQVRKLMAEITRAGRKTDLPLRAAIGSDGSLYVWDAWHATHSDVIDDLGVPTVGGYLYLAADHVFFNDLSLEHDEDAPGWDNGFRPYGRWLSCYYRATRSNPWLAALYGSPFRIVGEDYSSPPEGYEERFEITDEFMRKFALS